MDIITSHLNADFDAFASMVAAKRLYPEGRLVFPGSQEKKVRDFIDAFHPAELLRIKDIDFGQVDRLIVVDARSPERIGPLSEALSKKGLKVHIYDHHTASEEDIKGEVDVTEPVGATVTILVEILKKKGIRPTPMEATVMALGIHEETGSLLFPSTTERDVLALAHLVKCGASLRITSTYMRSELSREELDLLNELIQTSKDVIVHGVKVKLAKASREEYFGDAAHFAHRMMDMEDIDALVLMLRMEGKVLMVGRSRAPELDVSEVLGKFGGGGHPQAASATVKEMALELIEEKVLDILKSSVRPRKVAASIMTRPVITIEAASKVKDAGPQMTKYGVNVFPVLKAGKFAGIISREAVEKAIFHSLGERAIMDFTSTDVVTAKKDTPLRDVESAMVGRNQRFMPVLEDGKVVGAITRTDLLRVLYEESLSRDRVRESFPETRDYLGKNVASMLKDKFPSGVYDILALSGEIADGLGENAYLVGGSVRDLLRGEQNLDIDIVIEGDGIAFAKELGNRLGARVRTHEKFGTAKVIKAGLKLDVATARTEYYERPAALPTVEVSSIKKDLYRRDFTINTLSVKLNPPDFGQLLDFFGGRRDLREKVIRVLHNLSIVEDPTRAFRAARFAERFGFKISKHTEALIKTAVRMDLFEKLSGSRLYEEILLIFGEPDPSKTLKRLSSYGLLSVVHPSLAWNDETEAGLSSLHETLLWFTLSFIGEKPDKGVLYVMALFSGLGDDEKIAALQRLGVSSRLRDSVLKGIRDAKALEKRLPLKDPASIFEALSELPLETALFAMSLAQGPEKKKEISNYLLELRKLKPALTGDDLKEMGIPPGPLYRDILSGLLRERLRGAIKSKEDEEKFVKRFSKKPAQKFSKTGPKI